MTATEQELLEQAQAIARGRSSREPSVHHLIAFDLAHTRLEERVQLLLRTIGMLDHQIDHPDMTEAKPS